MDKIQFSFSGKCENLTYNMSYLTTIVHPLIIIRLLEHRLFTPLLKKTNSRAATSVSFSVMGAANPQPVRAPLSHSICVNPSANSNNIGSIAVITNMNSNSQSHLASLSNKKSPMSASTSFPNNNLVSIANEAQTAQSSNQQPDEYESKDKMNNKMNDDVEVNYDDTKSEHNRKNSQISLFKSSNYDKINDSIGFQDNLDNTTDNQKDANSLNINGQSPNSKTTYLKGLSKKILKRVNSKSKKNARKYSKNDNRNTDYLYQTPNEFDRDISEF